MANHLYPGKKGLVLYLIVMCALLATIQTAQANPIKQSMNEMKLAYNGAMNSTSIQEFARYAAQLQASASKASHLTYSSDPGTYQKGMQELQREIDLMNMAIKANDLIAAKKDLQNINQAKKHYHHLLN